MLFHARNLLSVAIRVSTCAIADASRSLASRRRIKARRRTTRLSYTALATPALITTAFHSGTIGDGRDSALTSNQIMLLVTTFLT